MNNVIANSERSVSPRPRAPRVHIGWFVWLAMFCLVIFGWKLLSGRPIEVPLAELAGQVTVNALFTSIGFILFSKFVVWVFVARRGREPARSPKVLAYAAIFFALYFGALAGEYFGTLRRVAAVSELEEGLTQFERESVDKDGMPVPTAGLAASAAQAAGKRDAVEQMIRDALAHFEAARNEYIAELEAIRWDSILHPIRLEQDTKLVESRAMVKQAESIVAKHEVRTSEMLRKTREQILALPKSEEYKRQMLAGFDGSVGGPNLPKLQELERQVVAHISDLVDVLAASQYGVGWTIQDGEMGFLNDDDMNKYNSYIEALQLTIAEQEALTAEIRARAKQQMAEMKQ